MGRLAEFLFVGAPHRPFRERLKALAERHGGQYQPRQGFFSGESAFADLPQAHSLIRIDVFSPPRDGSALSTRLRAHYVMGSGPDFTVFRKSALNHLADGFSNAASGEATFDRAFVIQVPPNTAVNKLWGDRARSLALSKYPNARFRASGELITMTFPYHVHVPLADLESAVELLGELAHSGIDRFSEVSCLQRAVFVPPKGPFGARTLPMLEVPLHGGSVLLTPTGSPLEADWTAFKATRRALPDFRTRLEAGEEFSVPEGLLPNEAKGHLAHALPGIIHVDNRFVRYRILGEVTEQRLMAAARLVNATARQSATDGPFR